MKITLLIAALWPCLAFAQDGPLTLTPAQVALNASPYYLSEVNGFDQRTEHALVYNPVEEGRTANISLGALTYKPKRGAPECYLYLSIESKKQRWADASTNRLLLIVDGNERIEAQPHVMPPKPIEQVEESRRRVGSGGGLGSVTGSGSEMEFLRYMAAKEKEEALRKRKTRFPEILRESSIYKVSPEAIGRIATAKRVQFRIEDDTAQHTLSSTNIARFAVFHRTFLAQ